ncbi:CBP domain-containing protein [Favolaschia claudopus]|uniref:CBP domain-containing protein n=1 Tax=Favolaschia claudopus TaxID=2862362 RepID=A0AAV9Z9F2_9AGAR
MQFSLVACLAAFATTALAGPAPLFLRQADSCDIANCVLDLAPSAVSCATAAAQAGADPVSDASCLIAVGKDVANLPASCNGCAAKFGVTLPPASSGGVLGSIESGLESAKGAVEDGLGKIGSAISGIF